MTTPHDTPAPVAEGQAGNGDVHKYIEATSPAWGDDWIVKTWDQLKKWQVSHDDLIVFQVYQAPGGLRFNDVKWTFPRNEECDPYYVSKWQTLNQGIARALASPAIAYAIWEACNHPTLAGEPKEGTYRVSDVCASMSLAGLRP